MAKETRKNEKQPKSMLNSSKDCETKVEQRKIIDKINKSKHCVNHEYEQNETSISKE